MEELYRNETFKIILLYSSIAIYLFIAFVLIGKKFFLKSTGNESIDKNTQVDTEDVRDLFKFEMPKNARSLKSDDDKEEQSDYDMSNNFFKDNKHNLDG